MIPFVGDQSVILGSQRVGPKQERIAMVVKGIEHDGNGVVTFQPVVPPLLGSQYPIGIGVIADDSNVQSGRTEKDAELSVFGRGLALVRLFLNKPQGNRSLLPGWLVEAPIHNQWRFCPHCCGGFLTVCGC